MLASRDRRRRGRGLVSAATAARRARVDAALVGLLFCGGLRRAEVAALVWADAEPPVRSSTRSREGVRAGLDRAIGALAITFNGQLRDDLREVRDAPTVTPPGELTDKLSEETPERPNCPRCGESLWTRPLTRREVKVVHGDSVLRRPKVTLLCCGH